MFQFMVVSGGRLKRPTAALTTGRFMLAPTSQFLKLGSFWKYQFLTHLKGSLLKTCANSVSSSPGEVGGHPGLGVGVGVGVTVVVVVVVVVSAADVLAWLATNNKKRMTTRIKK